MEKVIRKVRLPEQGTDFAYWQTRSYPERLEALETIRQEYHATPDGTQPRLPRVYRVVKRT